MARHYAIKHDDGTTETTLMSEFPAVQRALAGIEKPGLYRATGRTEGRWLLVKIGKRCTSVVGELERLRGLESKRRGDHVTGMPGIAGYSEMEHVINEAAYHNRKRTDYLSKWLEERS